MNNNLTEKLVYRKTYNKVQKIFKIYQKAIVILKFKIKKKKLIICINPKILDIILLKKIK